MEASRLPKALVFDLDGLLVESEQYWDNARRAFVTEHGGGWTSDDQRAVMGANSAEWAHYIRERFAVGLPPEQIIEQVVQRLLALYAEHVPVLPGAVETVRALAHTYPLAIASSSPRNVIGAVVGYLGLADAFTAIVSSDEVAQGKPAPDVYVEAARRVGVDPMQAVAFEDSPNGAAAAAAACMKVIAVPNRAYADPGQFEQADLVLSSLLDFHPRMLPALFVIR